MRWANLGVLLVVAAAPFTAWGQGPAAQTAPSTAAPVYITRQRAFSFPMNIPPASALGGEPAVVELWYSSDRGANWTKYDTRNLRVADIRPRESGNQGTTAPFVVQTDRDGEYYFASRILDALNRPLYQPAQLPEQRVIVDTIPPRIEFTATATATGEVQGQWRIFDEFLKPDSLTIEYQPAPNQPWQPVTFERAPANSVETSISGHATWRPQTSEHAVTFRVTVLDWAGNSAVATRTVTFSPPSGTAPLSPAPQDLAPVQPYAPSGSSMAAVSPGSPAAAAAPPAVATSPAGPAASSIAAAPIVTTPAATPVSPSVQTPPSPAPGATQVDPSPWPDDKSATSAAPALADQYPYRRPDNLTGSQYSASSPTNPPNRTADDAPGRFTYPTTDAPYRVSPVADGGARPLDASPTPPIGPQSLPGGERPRMTNAKKFELEYDVSSVGPQGVAQVELWITRDGGQTWQAWATDPDRQSPMEVSLDQEGVYGFRVVVTGRNGLSGPIPTSGESADVWIGVDTTAPTARLTGAQYGAGKQAGQLDIRWEADDAMLAARPITLLFSESPQGPWTIVATGLPNTGSYLWAVDPRTPQNIYLRLEVRDEAGNVGVDQLREPITLEGLQPKGRVKGIRPVEKIGLSPRPSALIR